MSEEELHEMTERDGDRSRNYRHDEPQTVSSHEEHEFYIRPLPAKLKPIERHVKRVDADEDSSHQSNPIRDHEPVTHGQSPVRSHNESPEEHRRIRPKSSHPRRLSSEKVRPDSPDDYRGSPKIRTRSLEKENFSERDDDDERRQNRSETFNVQNDDRFPRQEDDDNRNKSPKKKKSKKYESNEDREERRRRKREKKAKKLKHTARVTPEEMDDEDSTLNNTQTFDDSRQTPNSLNASKSEQPQPPPIGYEWADSKAEVPLYTCWKCFHDCKGCLKVLFAIFLFCVVTTTLLVSKGCLLFITSQMNPYVSFTQYGVRDLNNYTQCSVPQCKYSDFIDDDLNRECTTVESVRWIWAMFMVQCIPYLLVFCRCVWKMCFKKKKWPTAGIFIMVFMIESIYTIGIFMFLYIVLPTLDVTRGLFLMAGIAFVPALLNIFNDTDRKTWQEILVDILALLAQASAMIAWMVTRPVQFNSEHPHTEVQDVCRYNYTYCTLSQDEQNTEMTTESLAPVPEVCPLPTDFKLPEDAKLLWTLPLSVFFISLGYWENFLDSYSVNHSSVGLFTAHVRRSLRQCSTKTYLFISLWKILLTFICVLCYHSLSYNNPIKLSTLLNPSHFYDTEKTCGGYDGATTGELYTDWLEVTAIQLAMGIVCFVASDMAIQSKLQVQAFTIPLVLSTPMAYLLLIWACEGCDNVWKFTIHENWNFFGEGEWVYKFPLWDMVDTYYWNCFSGFRNYKDIFVDRYIWVGFFWWISLLWITRYLWMPKVKRLAKLDTIFTYAMPCGCLLEQSLMLMRRRNDEEINVREQDKARHETTNRRESIRVGTLSDDCVPTMNAEKLGTPFIYICATMWHESKEEMTSLLKSIIRMNIDQCARYGEKHIYNFSETDYYEFEAHIFFDDAFTPHNPGEDEYTINTYVRSLIPLVSEAASIEYNVNVLMDPPVKYDTPYGGRLEWELPLGKNRLIVHLKDNTKIRNKKRWSQVMYMNYLIGRGILKQEIDEKTKTFVAKNTYILALDGDVDFQPYSVMHLLDLMKRDEKVAASCGRVHPTGSGPIAWYQKFEYSLCHWFQKSTEHVLGSVLCSPGCFSLYRTSALMDVVKQYSSEASSPVHFIQYDQGEDRWLCTLLIQNSHRIEYCAAADAYTNAPQDFNEFFNQRRRWINSTFANIIELLAHGRSTAKKNESISLLYIAYQILLFSSSVLGPGVIFLLICGSFQLVWGVNPFISFLVASVPLIVFVLLCYHTKQNTQLFYALILSGIFALVQMIVLAGILRVVIMEGICATSTIFLIVVTGAIVLAAILHPLEFPNAVHMFFFYICIPSTYVILIIYSLCNVNQVSWGTRENRDMSVDKLKKKNRGCLYRYFNIELNDPVMGVDGSDEEEEEECCTCCFRYGCCHRLNSVNPDDTFNFKNRSTESLNVENDQSELHPELGPWKEEFEIVNGEDREIPEKEEEYWKILIQEYLYPLKEDSPEKRLSLKKGLNELRNKAVCWFMMIDLLVMVFVLSLNMSIDNTYDSGIYVNYTCGPDNNTYQIDPISFTFIFVFGSLIVIQTTGMIVHRVFTFIQIVSSVTLCQSQQVGSSLEDDLLLLKERSHGFAKEMLRVDFDDPDEDNLSVVTVLDDTVPWNDGKANKPRKSMHPDDMQKMIDARNIALKHKLDSPQDEIRRYLPSSSVDRRYTLYQPVIEVMRERMSASIPAEQEMLTRPSPQQIAQQAKVIDIILSET